MTKGAKDASGLYEVERRAYHAARPGFRIAELQISPAQTMYALRSATADGGLMSYGVDIPELFRQAAIYADRILKGEKAADLPVQLPMR